MTPLVGKINTGEGAVFNISGLDSDRVIGETERSL